MQLKKATCADCRFCLILGTNYCKDYNIAWCSIINDFTELDAPSSSQCFELKRKKKDPWDADLSVEEASKLMRKKVHFGDVTLFDMPDHEPRADKTQAMKILEESSEVLEAQKRYEQNPTLGNLADLRDEVADVIQATANFIGGLDAMGVADGALDFSDDMKLCEMRNISRGRISKEGE